MPQQALDMKTPRSFVAVSAAGVILLNGAAILFLIQQILKRYPINHVGYEPRNVGFVLLIGMAAAIGLWRHNREYFWMVVLSSLFVGFTLGTADTLNLLMEHGRWCQRGMPGPFQF